MLLKFCVWLLFLFWGSYLVKQSPKETSPWNWKSTETPRVRSRGKQTGILAKWNSLPQGSAGETIIGRDKHLYILYLHHADLIAACWMSGNYLSVDIEPKIKNPVPLHPQLVPTNCSPALLVNTEQTIFEGFNCCTMSAVPPQEWFLSCSWDLLCLGMCFIMHFFTFTFSDA